MEEKAAEHGVLVKAAFFELIMSSLLIIWTFQFSFPVSFTPDSLIGELKINAGQIDESQTRISTHPVLINAQVNVLGEDVISIRTVEGVY